MKIGPFILRLGRVSPHQSAIRNPQSAIPLKDPELAAAFAVPDTDPKWRALLQVIDTAREAAHKGAEEMSGANNQMCAYSAAGAHHLSLLKQEFVRLREQSLAQRPLRGTTAE